MLRVGYRARQDGAKTAQRATGPLIIRAVIESAMICSSKLLASTFFKLTRTGKFDRHRMPLARSKDATALGQMRAVFGLRSRSPSVQRIRLIFFVTSAVGFVDQQKTVLFIEASRNQIALKRP
jgi:hypothetical protein